MVDRLSVPPPPPDHDAAGSRISLCGGALVPILSSLARDAQDAGWTEREVMIAVMTWATTRAAMIDGGEVVAEALARSLQAARGQGG